MRAGLLSAITGAAFLLTLPPGGAASAERTPDFSNPTAVQGSLKGMKNQAERRVRDGGDWTAQRAAGVCAEAVQRLEWRRTARAYDEEAGEAIWRDCQQAYDRIR